MSATALINTALINAATIHKPPPLKKQGVNITPAKLLPPAQLHTNQSQQPQPDQANSN
jgi:hypothetical protein